MNYITKLKLKCWLLYLSITVKAFRNENLIIQISCSFIDKFCAQKQHVYRKTGIIISGSSVLDIKCFMPIQTTFEYGRVRQTIDLKICFCTPSTGISWYSQQLLGGLSPHWDRWGQEALAVLCPLQDPEVLVAQEVLEALQILYHPENIRMLVYVTTHFFMRWAVWCILKSLTLGPSGPGAPGWPCGPGFPGLPVSPCEPLIPGTPGIPGGPTDPGWPCEQRFRISVTICYKGFRIIYCSSITLINFHDAHKHVLNRNLIFS